MYGVYWLTCMRGAICDIRCNSLLIGYPSWWRLRCAPWSIHMMIPVNMQLSKSLVETMSLSWAVALVRRPYIHVTGRAVDTGRVVSTEGMSPKHQQLCMLRFFSNVIDMSEFRRSGMLSWQEEMMTLWYEHCKVIYGFEMERACALKSGEHCSSESSSPLSNLWMSWCMMESI